MLEDAGPSPSAADGADAASRPLHGGRIGRGLRHSQPHGLRTLATHAAVRFFEQRERGRKAYYRIVEMHLAGIIACIESRFGQHE